MQQLMTVPFYYVINNKEYKHNKQNHVTHPAIVSRGGHVLHPLHAAT